MNLRKWLEIEFIIVFLTIKYTTPTTNKRQPPHFIVKNIRIQLSESAALLLLLSNVLDKAFKLHSPLKITFFNYKSILSGNSL